MSLLDSPGYPNRWVKQWHLNRRTVTARTVFIPPSAASTLQAAGIQLELLTGPLTGIYGSTAGMGAMLFAVLAVAAQLDRDYIRNKILEGQQTAAAEVARRTTKVINDDKLAFASALRDKGVPVPDIAAKLTIKTGKNAGRHPSVASVYLALADVDATDLRAAAERTARKELNGAAATPPSGHSCDAARPRSRRQGRSSWWSVREPPPPARRGR
ncbi:MAG: hypothetical protein JWP34_5174 [Massilia sp.]|nr:hypothetical protein [Massilia sp.]